ncbi:MAG: aspartate aminotransferase family protein [Rikenellaceae bacterium]
MNILRKQFLAHVGQTSPSPMMIEVERSEGVYFYTPENKAYFDLISGVSVSNVGHSNPCVTQAVKDQVDKYMHIMVYGEMIEAPQVQYAKMICDAMPEGLDSVYFASAGGESIDIALKLAKRVTSRTEIISCLNAYHGSTHGALSVMGGEEYKTSFRPLLPDVRQIRYNNFEDLELITSRTACFLVEPVQGEAGVVLPAKGYLEAARERCDKTGTLLIFDEVQMGFGRTGAMFACQKFSITPDVIVLAKALGGGMPLGAVVSSRERLNKFTSDPVLGHISTFGGHPVCCAAGMASMKYIMDNNLLENAEAMGAKFESLLKNHSRVKEIRRVGLLLAVELGSSDKMFAMMEMFAGRGILSDWFLFCDTAFRISPPLIISKDEVEACCEIILACLDDL